MKYLTIKQLAEDERFPVNMGQLRDFLMRRHDNGLELAVRKVGKRLYVREDLFEQWFEQGGKL